MALLVMQVRDTFARNDRKLPQYLDVNSWLSLSPRRSAVRASRSCDVRHVMSTHWRVAKQHKEPPTTIRRNKVSFGFVLWSPRMQVRGECLARSRSCCVVL